MKTVYRVLGVILLVLSIFLTSTCKKEEEPKIVKSKVTGLVQKGPYVNGTSISMFELNSSLSQTGNSFTTQITSNNGSFEITNINLTSSYVEFNASGYYFDEVKGELSVAPLNLFALSDIRDISTVNINIMTHLEKQRVDYLMKQNKTFSEAKKTAQGEILSIFGFSLSGINKSEALDISVNSEDNAILLAISVILQGNRSVGDLTELLANISNDLKEDGIVNSTTVLSDLRSSAKLLNPSAIRTNLEKRYQDLGLTVTIPGFEKYVNDFLAYTGEKPIVTTLQPIDVSTTSAKFNGTVNPNSLSTTVIFEYGKTTSYTDSISAEQSPITGSTSINVSKIVTTLLPGTTYHFRVKARNSKGTTYGDDLTLTTLGQSPVATTLAATEIFATTATLNGKVNPNLLSTVVTFEYGLTTEYGDSLTAGQSPVTGSTISSVSAQLSGLNEGTTYHFRIKAKNTLGTSNGVDMTFKTTNLTGTLPASDIKTTSVTLNGTINANIPFTSVSFEYGKTTSYGVMVIATQDPIPGPETTKVSASIEGLEFGTTYHYRLIAINSQGTIYGDDISFITIPTTVSDLEGNRYKVVLIGTEVWMAEDLRTTKYNDGTPITNITNDLEWSNPTSAAYCWYNNDEEKYKEDYGALYNWHVATSTNPRNVCPVGWHVPSNAEWTTLEIYLQNNGYNYDGTIDTDNDRSTNNRIAISLASTTSWSFSLTPGAPGNPDYNEYKDKTGFSAKANGTRFPAETGGKYWGLNTTGYWWASSGGSNFGDHRTMYNDKAYFDKQMGMAATGYAIRCLMDK
jgi:uncharacterized protein (TIGR02145 family)